MNTLKHELNLARPDDVYNLIVDAHNGLTAEQSEKLNAALVLLLANHVGDEDVIREAVAAARKSVTA
ncbi:MAG: DUF2783 domain-containing protein [Alphaproteobacteria bacterium]|nr:DUF2783 domain-containing protein [Alphaproteobacteria bacterium]